MWDMQKRRRKEKCFKISHQKVREVRHHNLLEDLLFLKFYKKQIKRYLKIRFSRRSQHKSTPMMERKKESDLMKTMLKRQSNKGLTLHLEIRML